MLMAVHRITETERCSPTDKKGSEMVFSKIQNGILKSFMNLAHIVTQNEVTSPAAVKLKEM